MCALEVQGKGARGCIDLWEFGFNWGVLFESLWKFMLTGTVSYFKALAQLL